MVKQQIFNGKTVEEAIETGLAALSVSRDQAEIEILEEGKKKLFGSVPAQVKISVKETRTDGERAVDFLKGLLSLLKTEATPLLKSEGLSTRSKRLRAPLRISGGTNICASSSIAKITARTEKKRFAALRKNLRQKPFAWVKKYAWNR